MLRGVLTRCRNAARSLAGRGESWRVPITYAAATEFHGGPDYGGWAIASNSLHSESIVYSFGVGEDASFDLSLIAKYGCAIHAFDPTPKSVSWVKHSIQEPRFRFQPWALAGHDGGIRLFLPRNPDHVSASCVEGKHTRASFIDAPCRRLATVMKELDHDHIDLLKMDIEGAEYDVVADLAASGALGRLDQVLIEFHHRFANFGARHTRRAVAALRRHGLESCWTSATGLEVLFRRRPVYFRPIVSWV